MSEKERKKEFFPRERSSSRGMGLAEVKNAKKAFQPDIENPRKFRRKIYGKTRVNRERDKIWNNTAERENHVYEIERGIVT